MILSKPVCKSCVDTNRNAIEGEGKEQRVRKSPWSKADDALWEQGTVVCYNNTPNPTNTIPFWCPHDEIQRALMGQQKQTPNECGEEAPQPPPQRIGGLKAKRAKKIHTQDQHDSPLTNPADTLPGAQLPEIVEVSEEPKTSLPVPLPPNSDHKVKQVKEISDDEALRDTISEL